MADKTDFLLALYQNDYAHCRHYETQQASVTNIIVVVSAGIIAFIANNGVTKDKWPLALFLFAVGLFGVLFSVKQRERSVFYFAAAREYRNELETVLNFDLTHVRQRVEAAHQDNHPYLYKKVSLVIYWVVLHSLIGTLGLFFFGYTLSR